MHINMRYRGWTIRDYRRGDIYADVYCPHGFPVDVINAANVDDFKTWVALRNWVLDAKDWREEYCYDH